MTATAPIAFAAIDAVFDRFHATVAAPGVAFGVIVDGELVHAGGRGSILADGRGEPGPDTRYRIASMTKSFTAAAILRLRDHGALRLDDEVSHWVPEIDPETTRTSVDGAPITIRSLLTMTSGLPTDDPWGDRQLGLDEAAFLRFLAAGPQLAWPTGTQMEYSNTGYAVLGLVVARASGESYRGYVERTILEPLGLTRTSFDVAGVGAGEVAPGYVRRDGRWSDEPIDPHGAFAPMGGLFSSVRDLATWVATFLAATPARDDPDAAIPVARATFREMQSLHRSISPELRWTSAGEPPVPFVSGYGFGLFVVLDAERGRIVTHSGGVPGYGSNMRWHPASGTGVVAVANGRYAPLGLVCRDALNALIDGGARPARRPRPWPETAAARESVERLIDAWDDDLAARTFAMNIALDEPLDRRRAEIDGLRASHGRLRPDDREPVVCDTPAHLAWWLAGDRGGRVRVEIQMSPERPPRVQWLELTSVPDPPPRLARLAERVVAILVEPDPVWPSDIGLGDLVDRDRLGRELAATAALFGPLGLGPAIAGDGRASASWCLGGSRGAVTLSLSIDPEGAVTVASLVPAGLTSPVEAD